MAEEKAQLEVAEKPHTTASSDIEKSSGLASPAEYDTDDLPDPDAGKSDAERAKLVRLSTSASTT